MEAILLDVIAAYGIAGVAVAVAFLAIGVTKVLPQASMTIGARAMVLPGTAVLWPVILRRWRQARTTR